MSSFLNARDNKGATPLYAAAMNGHLETVVYLLSAGADPTIPDNEGVTPQGIAAKNGHEEVARYLEDSSRGPSRAA